MVDAIPALVTEKAVKLYERFGIYTSAELQSRAEIQYDTYAKAVNIEARTMIDMAGKQIIPAVIKAVKALADSMASVAAACPEADVSVQKELLLETSAYLSETKVALAALQEAASKASAVREENACQAAHMCHDLVLSLIHIFIILVW